LRMSAETLSRLKKSWLQSRLLKNTWQTLHKI
jgi:hypothetical protein